jgi:hypothetical protein
MNVPNPAFSLILLCLLSLNTCNSKSEIVIQGKQNPDFKI